MFEEEAEEYKDNTRIKDKNTYIGFPDERISEVQDYEGNYIDISERIIKTFKDGAEFGYNKANEWHYVKDGKLPKTGNPCLVYLVNDCAIVARLREDNVWTTDGHNAFENVIAWKEIVPPKEIKENE